jgi:predicted membrane-bound spermidine synthase
MVEPMAREHKTTTRSPRLAPWAVAYTAFFLSGVAGLIHEIVWSNLLVQLIGATAYAQSAVLAVFMAGLAIGSVVFGRRVDRRGHALQTYVVLEVLIGVYCLVLPLLLRAVEAGYVRLAGLAVEAEGAKLALRLGLAVLVVLLPAVWMGGTLPLIARHLIDRLDETQRRVGSLYALNSFGAVVGAGLAGFLLLPALGVPTSLALASSLNLAAAGLGAALGRLAPSGGAAATTQFRRASHGSDAAPTTTYPPLTYRVTLLALVLSGFAAMGYEVVFIRIISLSFGSSTYSFTVMLMSFIAGIALGSALIARRRVEHPLWWLGTSQLLVVVALLAVSPLVARLPYLTGLLRIATRDVAGGFGLYQLGSAALCLAVLLIPTACLGFGFPLVAQVQARHPQEVGTRVGTTYAWNTVGNVLGVLVTSLALIPGLGVLGAFHLNLALNAVAGLALLAVAAEVAPRVRIGCAAGLALVAAVYAATGADWIASVRQATGHLRLHAVDATADAAERAADPTASFANWKDRFVRDDEVVFLEDDAHVTVLAWQEGGELSLNVNGKPDATTGGDLPTQLLLAHAPLFLNPGARSVLVIGHGSGITAGSALRHPLERLDVVEISSSVLHADHLFRDHNYAVLSDPRVHAYVDDGQSFLRTVPRLYDVIISEPSNPWIAGIGGLFTVDFFETVKSRLAPGGLFCMWFHAYEQSDETLQLVMRTLGKVFPHAVMFAAFRFTDLIWVASDRPIVADFAAMEDRFDTPPVRNDLARIGATNLAALLSHHAVSSGRFGTLVDDGPVNTSAHQLLEYAAAKSFFREEQSERILDLLPYFRGRSADEDVFLERYAAYRESAGEPISRGELETVASHLESEDLEQDTIGQTIAAKIREWAVEVEGAASPGSRPARGRMPTPAEMGFYELGTWAERRFEAGDFDGAAALLERALAERPVRPDLVHTIAFGLQEAGEKERGWALIQAGFERSLDADPADGESARALADLLRLDDDWRPKAQQAVQQRLTARPNDAVLAELSQRLRSSG